MRRVVITGMGAVCCLGTDVPTFWRRLIAGESGIAPIERFDPSGLRNNRAGEVKGWDSAALMPEGPRDVDLATQFCLVATREALQDRGTALVEETALRAGAVLSTNFGGAEAWEGFAHSISSRSAGVSPAAPEVRVGQASPPVLAGGTPALREDLWREFTFHSALGHVCSHFGLRGPRSVLSLSCSSGVAAMGQAFDLIRLGRADLMVAGGHDSLSISSLAGLSALHTITPDEIRPFDARRNGTLFGEGAAMLVLEEYEHAKARGATVHAVMLGYGLNNNAYHLTAPDKGGAGMAEVLRMAFRDAGVPTDSIDYVSAHGTGTEYHDPAETQAIKSVLGERAYAIPVSSIKAATSHIMGGAGSLEVIAAVLAMRDGVVPPTLNWAERDPECDLDYVPNEARRVEVDVALSNAMGLGGHNACVLVGRVDG